jgi:hypothetical protein
MTVRDAWATREQQVLADSVRRSLDAADSARLTPTKERKVIAGIADALTVAGHTITPTKETENMTDTSTMPATVTAALARVMVEIGGIDKLSAKERAARGMGGGDQGIAYAYRGIDQIAAKAQPLLGKHGVVIIPTIIESRIEPITINSKPWVDHFITVRWSVYGPGGLEDRIESVTMGIGRDNSDKSANKAMTGAFKNLLLRLLCIGDPADDTDGHTVERDAPKSRTAEILNMFDGITDGKIRHSAKSRFMDVYGVPPDGLAVELHDDAVKWLPNEIEILMRDADDRAAADRANAAAENEPQTTP